MSSSSLSCLRETDTGVEVFLFVQPRASRNKVVGLVENELKVALTAPPVDGAANKACVVFFAKLCKLQKSGVKIVAGETSRHKRLHLEGIDYEKLSEIISSELGLDIGR